MRSEKLILLGGTLFIAISLLFHNCATIVQSECELQFFEGKYVGQYSLGIATIPVVDTVTIVIDEANNKATLTSNGLGVAIETNYQVAKKQLVIGTFISPEFVFEPDTLFDINIAEGTVTLDPACENLNIELNNVSVQDYTNGLRGLLGAPPLNLNALKGTNMRRIQ